MEHSEGDQRVMQDPIPFLIVLGLILSMSVAVVQGPLIKEDWAFGLKVSDENIPPLTPPVWKWVRQPLRCSLARRVSSSAWSQSSSSDPD